MATPSPGRATGATTLFRIAFEAEYGVPPAGDWTVMPCYTYGLSEEEQLEEDALLGKGRDPQDDVPGAFDVTGRLQVPLDQRVIGFWLTGLLGAPIDSAPVGARGHIDFKAQPTAGDTITLGGTVWAFTDGSPGSNQTQIGADLAATLTQLAEDLNGSADAAIAAATYTAERDRLVIQHDTADTTGNSFALAASSRSAKASWSTLAGGGFNRHVWVSGADNLCSLSTELFLKRLVDTANRHTVHSGIMVNSLSISRERSGAARADLDLIAQSETEAAASIAGTPTDLGIKTFGQTQGGLRVESGRIANLTGGQITIGNNLDVVEGLRDDGLIDGADPGIMQLQIDLTQRYSDTALKQAAENRTDLAMDFGFRDPPSGAEILFTFHRVKLPKPRREIGGPGGVEVTYQGRPKLDTTAGQAMTVHLINDVADSVYQLAP